jgi:hypothetical protein
MKQTNKQNTHVKEKKMVPNSLKSSILMYENSQQMPNMSANILSLKLTSL